MLAVGIPAAILISLLLTAAALGQSRAPEVIAEREDGSAEQIERTGDTWTITEFRNGTPVATRQANPRESSVLDTRAIKIDREQRTDELLAVLETLRADIAGGRALTNSEITAALDALAEWIILNGH